MKNTFLLVKMILEVFTAKVRSLNRLSLEFLCAYWKLQLGGKHVSPREHAFGSLQSCKNGRLGGAAVTAKV